jgi:hypothetical protein
MSTGRAPFTWELDASAPPVTTASGVQAVIVGEADEAATVTEAALLPAAAVTANASAYRTWTVFNRGTAGTGTVSVATVDTSTTGLTDNDERTMTLSTASGALTCAAGDVVEVVETVATTGVAHGGYEITVTLSRL